MIHVLTYGNFDTLHYGHVDYLRKCKEYGDNLVVGLSTDYYSEHVKGKKPYLNYDRRYQLLSGIRYVDQIIPESCLMQKQHDILEYGIDLLILGAEWSPKFDFLNKYCSVKYISRTPKISSTMIKSCLMDDIDLG